ncbi:hypothetical protein K3Z88_25495, partial [Pseudomonas aeruginosa]|nr:hypothetical protein [Pseudomonas aeruginosa]
PVELVFLHRGMAVRDTLDGRLQVLDTGRYLGQPDDWRAFLETQLRLAGGSGALGGAAAPLCRIDGCA